MIHQDTSQQEVQYNIGAKKLEAISELLLGSIRSYRKHDIQSWYIDLKGIKHIIISNLSDAERKTCLQKEKKIEQYLYRFKDASNLSADAQQIHTFNTLLKRIVIPLVSDYNRTIMNLLTLKGYDVPFKEDNTNLFDQEDPDS